MLVVLFKELGMLVNVKIKFNYLNIKKQLIIELLFCMSLYEKLKNVGDIDIVNGHKINFLW